MTMRAPKLEMLRRWTTHYRGDTHNNGPVQWISENYVCPTCSREPNHKCCKNVPETLFCIPDALNMTEKTPRQLSNMRNCEAYRFISGADETALPSEIGLYFEFQNSGNGFPVGCPGFDKFDGINKGTWSAIDGVKADPQCKLQTLANPTSDHPTSWYMRKYAVDQERFITDFSAVLDKMLSNGYTDLTLGEDQFTGIECSDQRVGSWGQCWEAGTIEELGHQYVILNKLDGRVTELVGSKVLVNTIDDENIMQRWYLRFNGKSVQFVNAGNDRLLSVMGISDFELGKPDNEGYFEMIATGGLTFRGKSVAMDRGPKKEDGRPINVWELHGRPNQKYKLVIMDNNL